MTGSAILCAWILAILAIAIVVSKIFAPEASYRLKLSLIISACGFGIYAIILILSLLIHHNEWSFWPGIGLALCTIYIISGGKQLPYKTQTVAFSKVTQKPLAVVNSGSLIEGWIDTTFEQLTVNPGNNVDSVANLQAMPIEIHETPDLITKDGIKAKIKHIHFLLEIHGDIRDLFDVANGPHVVDERIRAFIDEFFIKRVGKIEADTLDTDKESVLETLSIELEKAINKFCKDSGYPYQIASHGHKDDTAEGLEALKHLVDAVTKDHHSEEHSEEKKHINVLIGDVDLDPKYYEARAKQKIADLEAKAEKIKADSLGERIKNLSTELMGTEGTAAERIDKAMIAMGTIKKDVSEKKLSLGITEQTLLETIVKIIVEAKKKA